MPVLENNCHSATSNTGPRNRCTARGTTCLRCRFSASARGSTSVAVGSTLVFARTRESTVAMSGGSEEVASQRFGFASVWADGNVADQRDAVQYPVTLDVFEVLRREMQCGPVVPERDATRLPLEANGVLGTVDLLEQQVEDVAALPWREVDYLAGEARVDVQHRFPRVGVNPDHRMDRRQRITAY